MNVSKLNKCLGFVVVMLFLTGCSLPEQQSYVNIKSDYINVHPICEDSIICYVYAAGYGVGLGCFRDEDLVRKYCGDEKR